MGKISKSLLVIFIGIVAWPPPNECAPKSCNNVFQCMGYLLIIPLKDVVNASTYYSGPMMGSLGGVSDEDWNKQMTTLGGLCDLWVKFDQCMGEAWTDCIDWNQLFHVIEILSRNTTTAGRPENSFNKTLAMNKTHQEMSKFGMSPDELKKMVNIATMVCKNAPSFLPHASCFRDMMIGNETILNATMRYASMMNVSSNFECVQPAVTCAKVAKMNAMVGHWLYHACPGFVSTIDVIARLIFQTWTFNNESCDYIFAGKTNKELYEPPYDMRTEYDFGNDLSRCPIERVKARFEEDYRTNVAGYFRNVSISKQEYYHRIQCRMRNISLNSCNIWPYGMPPGRRTTPLRRPRTTTPTTTAALITTEEPTTTTTSPPRMVLPVAQRLTSDENSATNKKPVATSAPRRVNVRRPTTKEPGDDSSNSGHSIHCFQHIMPFSFFIFIFHLLQLSTTL